MTDTPEKRKSVANLNVGTGVTPNASKDREWRQEVAGNYVGIATQYGLSPPESVKKASKTAIGIGVGLSF